MSTNPLPPGQPPPGVRKTDSTLTWIFGTLGALVLVVVLGALLVGGLVLRRIHVHGDGQRVEIETPMGAVRVNKGAADSGLPIYPGATAREEEGASVQVTAPNEEGAGIAVAKLHASEGFDAVQKWYADRLGPRFRQQTREEMLERHSQDRLDEEDADLAFIWTYADGAEVVALTRAGGGTDIDLVRAGKREIQ